jgi:hypothetical protein
MQQPVVYSKFVTLSVSVKQRKYVRVKPLDFCLQSTPYWPYYRWGVEKVRPIQTTSVHIWNKFVRNGNGQMQQPVVCSEFVTVSVSVRQRKYVRVKPLDFCLQSTPYWPYYRWGVEKVRPIQTTSVHIWNKFVRNSNGQMQQPVVCSEFVTVSVSVRQRKYVRVKPLDFCFNTEYMYAVWFQY